MPLHTLRLIVAVVAAFVAACLSSNGLAQSPYGPEAPAVAMAQPPSPAPPPDTDAATLDGCLVVARIDGQIVMASEVLWMVNHLIEANRDKIPPEELEAVREQLMKRELAMQLDRKLLYNEFRRTIDPQALPQIEGNLDQPFEEHEAPLLMKQLKLESRHQLDQELARLGSSIGEARRAFNEKAIAGEWLRSKVKINESVSPDEMLEYYQSHLAEYEFPTQARWEELMVRKAKYRTPQEAYAALAAMGNEVWQRAAAQGGVNGVAFAEVAKARSDGFTAQNGGLQDWTTKGALKAAVIDQALFSLDVGQMSPILETDSAFHIVRVLERKEAGRRPFTDVQGEIRDKLKEQRHQAAVEAYLESLRSQARIWTIFTGNVSADILLGRRPEEGQAR